VGYVKMQKNGVSVLYIWGKDSAILYSILPYIFELLEKSKNIIFFTVCLELHFLAFL
jgi:hypothetical protein